jgi:hypothetical protein
MLRNFFNSQLSWLLAGLTAAHLLSFTSFTWPLLNQLGFLIILATAIYLSWRDLRLAISLLILELLVGSQGYLFSWDFSHFQLSLRIALWSVIMIAWLVKLLYHRQAYFASLKKFLVTSSARYYLLLSLACLSALIIGLIRNQLPATLLDANSWFFLALALPIWTEFRKMSDFRPLLPFLYAGLIYLTLETLSLAYIFSHDLGRWPAVVYSWLRATRLAEITWTPHGFWRIFLQSQLYFVPAFLGLNLLYLKQKLSKQQSLLILLSGGLLSTTLFFSLSRSLWLGLVAGLIILAVLQIRHLRQLGQFLIFNLSSLIIASLLVIAIVSSGSASFAALLDRANLQTEAAASSRWQLLPVIWQDIQEQVVFGQGFGATITYHSQDPRALAANPDGLYTTYAFEWGWLDLWLKLGLWGALAYLVFLLHSAYKLYQQQTLLSIWLSLSLLSLIIIHFFTPYLNHPLGFLILLLSIQSLELSRLEKGEGSSS